VDGFAKAATHAVAQGAVAQARDGGFRGGFWGAFVSSILAPTGSNIAVSTFKASLAGGIGAKLGGGKFANGAMSAAFVHLFNDKAGREPETDEYKIGIELKKRIFKAYGSTDGSGRVSVDVKAMTFSVNESGELIVSGQAGMVSGSYQLGKGLDSLGLKFPGVTGKISNFSKDSIKWTVTVPTKIFGLTFKPSYSGSFNVNVLEFQRNRPSLSPFFDRVENPNLRCEGGCGI
jgi:hypothetical protein